MGKPSTVYCPNCNEIVGKDYPATWEEPAWYEGIEDYFDESGVPFCSTKCRDDFNKEEEKKMRIKCTIT